MKKFFRESQSPREFNAENPKILIYPKPSEEGKGSRSKSNVSEKFDGTTFPTIFEEDDLKTSPSEIPLFDKRVSTQSPGVYHNREHGFKVIVKAYNKEVNLTTY